MHAVAVARGLGMAGLLVGCHAGPHAVRVIATDYALQAPDSMRRAPRCSCSRTEAG